jgi:hypothetical protein
MALADEHDSFKTLTVDRDLDQAMVGKQPATACDTTGQKKSSAA